MRRGGKWRFQDSAQFSARTLDREIRPEPGLSPYLARSSSSERKIKRAALDQSGFFRRKTLTVVTPVSTSVYDVAFWPNFLESNSPTASSASEEVLIDIFQH